MSYCYRKRRALLRQSCYINVCNSLPDHNVTSPAVACFRRRLNTLDFSLWCCSLLYFSGHLSVKAYPAFVFCWHVYVRPTVIFRPHFLLLRDSVLQIKVDLIWFGPGWQNQRYSWGALNICKSEYVYSLQNRMCHKFCK